MDDLQTGHPASEEELEQTLCMTARAFRGTDSPEAVSGFRRDHERPGHRPELHRVLKLDGKIVAGALIVDRDLRVGSAVLRCGGIADVATDPQYRKRGLGRRIMEHCVEWMAEQDYDVTLLFGIVDYYDKFGYRPTGCETSVSLSVDDVSQAATGGLRASAVRKADLPALARLHAQTDKLLRLSFVRTPAYWEYLLKRMAGAKALRDTRGKLVAVWHGGLSDDAYQVRQIAAAPKATAMSALLAHCARTAKRAGARRVHLSVSPDHPVAQHARELGAQLAARYPRNSGCMVRVLNLDSTLTKLAPELAARLTAADMRQPARLRLVTEIGSADLRVAEGEVAVAPSSRAKAPCVRLDQGRLAQLFCGYRGIDDLARMPDVTAPAATRALLRALFPEGSPFIWPADRF